MASMNTACCVSRKTSAKFAIYIRRYDVTLCNTEYDCMKVKIL